MVCNFLSFGSPAYCCIQCSELGYLGSIVSCQACHGWLQSSWWTISVDMSGEQLGKCMQWHDITSCTGVDLALESHKSFGSNFSWHLDSHKGFCCWVYLNIRYLNCSRISSTPLVSISKSFCVRWCLQNNCDNTNLIIMGVFISSNFIDLLLSSSSVVVFRCLVLRSFMSTLTLGLQMSFLLTSMAYVILCWAWWSARWVGLCAVSTWVHSVCWRFLALMRFVLLPLWHWLSSVPSISWPQGCLRWQYVFGTLQAS